jgi:hypothetical protein
VSARALRILRRVAEKQPEMFQTCLTSGLKVTADFHERIRSNYRTSTSDAAGGGLAVYSVLAVPCCPSCCGRLPVAILKAERRHIASLLISGHCAGNRRSCPF